MMGSIGRINVMFKLSVGSCRYRSVLVVCSCGCGCI
jgi:hypothetical protein